MAARETSVGPLEDTLAFPFREEGWQSKLLIGTLVQLAMPVIPLLPAVTLAGYSARIMHRIIVEDGEPHLPKWDDWNTLLGDGLKLFGVTIAYAAPAVLVAIAAYLLVFAVGMGGAFVAESAYGENSPLAPLAAMTGMFGGMATFGLAWFMGLVTSVLLPPAQGHVIATGEFGAAFRVREWWAVFRANLSGYAACLLLMMGLWTVYMFIMQILYMTVCLCCLIPLAMAPVMLCTSILSHALFARAYRIGADKLAAARD
jgi:hypothetical protein